MGLRQRMGQGEVERNRFRVGVLHEFPQSGTRMLSE